MSIRIIPSSLAVFIAVSLVACLEDDEAAEMTNLSEKLDGQRFDIGRTKEIIASEKLKLEKFKQASIDMKESEELTKSIDSAEKEITAGKANMSELADSIQLLALELKNKKAAYRVRVRKEAIGQNIDLSETLGEKFKAVRIMAISPLAVKIYTSAGPQNVPLKDLPSKVREMLQMSEEEVAEHLQKQSESATARAKKFEKWKAGQADRDKESAKQAVLQRIKDLREEIFQREDDINKRLQELKAWKSKASNMELEAAREKNEATSRKLERLADLARDKALELTDQNSDSWIVVGRLKSELEDLKRMGIR